VNVRAPLLPPGPVASTWQFVVPTFGVVSAWLPEAASEPELGFAPEQDQVIDVAKLLDQLKV